LVFLLLVDFYHQTAEKANQTEPNHQATGGRNSEGFKRELEPHCTVNWAGNLISRRRSRKNGGDFIIGDFSIHRNFGDGHDQHYNALVAVTQNSMLIVATSLSNHPTINKKRNRHWMRFQQNWISQMVLQWTMAISASAT
jgi:hypothetical protein